MGPKEGKVVALGESLDVNLLTQDQSTGRELIDQGVIRRINFLFVTTVFDSCMG